MLHLLSHLILTKREAAIYHPHYTDENWGTQRALGTPLQMPNFYCYKKPFCLPDTRYLMPHRRTDLEGGVFGSESQKLYRIRTTSLSPQAFRTSYCRTPRRLLLLLLVLITYSIIADAVWEQHYQSYLHCPGMLQSSEPFRHAQAILPHQSPSRYTRQAIVPQSYKANSFW